MAFVQAWINELKSIQFWKAVIAEYLGTLLLVFMGCSVCLDGWQTGTAVVTIVQISLTFGLAVATVVWCIAHVSGGHINPAVTAGMLVTRKITVVRAIFYILAQSLGAIAGAGLLYHIHPHDPQNTKLGNTVVDKNVSLGSAFGMELIITFVLVFTVFASCDKYRKDLGGSVPLTIGLSIALCHMFAIKYTGSSMNPARSFGPAVVAGIWKGQWVRRDDSEFVSNLWANHWLYWLGPITGGILAGLLYDLVFAADSSLQKAKSIFTLNGPNPEPADTPRKGDV
jgi:aquaporin-4